MVFSPPQGQLHDCKDSVGEAGKQPHQRRHQYSHGIQWEPPKGPIVPSKGVSGISKEEEEVSKRVTLVNDMSKESTW